MAMGNYDLYIKSFIHVRKELARNVMIKAEWDIFLCLSQWMKSRDKELEEKLFARFMHQNRNFWALRVVEIQKRKRIKKIPQNIKTLCIFSSSSSHLNHRF